MSVPVTAVVRQFHTEITTTDHRVDGLIERTVPSRGRERDPLTWSWIVFASHWPGLLTEMRLAGYAVDVEPGPGAR